jgi:VWFA-related protein
MRKISLLLLSLVLALPAFAARRLTVDQLDQALAALAGKPDADAAWQIAQLEPAEWFSQERLARWQAELPGETTRLALIALADRSAYLDPPATDLLSMPAPDFAEQRRIMGLVVNYVSKTIPTLPNFFATRNTSRFEDTPQYQSTSGSLVPFEPLHRVGESSVTVLYRDGREVVDGGDPKHKTVDLSNQGLTTWGVFGPILSTVLLDAAQSKLAWSHWEQDAGGPQAVFTYAVPREKSHYEVNYCCVAEEAGSLAANVHPFKKIVGYHGKMAVDPATGTILRVTVEAELKSTDPVSEAGIMVEYGPVDIGGKTYFCPVRSVSTTLAQSVQVDPRYHFALANQVQPLKNALNDVRFADYHQFRSDARVLSPSEATAAAQLQPLGSAGAPKHPGAAAAGTNAQLAASDPAGSASSAQPSQPSTSGAPAEAAAASGPPETASIASAPPSAAAPAPAAESASPEISAAPATGIPDIPVTAASDQPGFTVRAVTRLVDVGLVAFDKKGRPITDLKPTEFEVYDNGRKQELRYFSQAGTTAPASQNAADPVDPNEHASQPAPDQPEFSNRRPLTTAVAPEASETVLLIDSSNVAFGDLTYARQEMLRFLKQAPGDQRVGLYVLKSHGFDVLMEPTADHAEVAAKLAHWMPSAQDLAKAQDEERRNRQQIDFVHNAMDLTHVNGNGSSDPESFFSGAHADAAAAAQPVDAQLQGLGSNPGRDALFLLAGVARHLAAIPGHKTLVWVSSDNVLADWSSQTAAKNDKGGKPLDPLALRAQESLNDAHTSIYPLDASQLEAGGIGADIGTRNVLAVGKSDRDPSVTLGDATPGMNPGRATAQMQQDTHPIQGMFRDLAAATGGRTLRRASDLSGELNGIVADGRAAYLLSFSPDSPADDKYHVLTVKLVGRRDITLHYRAGYLAAKEPATFKDRFRQAIWQPVDASEIAVGATPVKGSAGDALKLNIAATDLSLAQQGQVWMDKLDIFLVLRDDAALHANVSGQTLGLRLKPSTYQRVLRDGIPFDQLIEKKPGAGSIRMVVVDENSGRIGSVTLPAASLAN